MARPYFRPKSPVVLALILTFALVNSAAADADLEAAETSVQYRPVDGVYHPGDSIWISSEVVNIGDETSDSFTIDFYLSDYSLGSALRAGLGPQELDVSTATFAIPDEIPYGDYSVRIEVSGPNDSNPDNNETSDSWVLTYAEERFPDLQALSVSGMYGPDDGIYHRGEPVVVGWGVGNAGDETSAGYTIDFYVGDYSMGSKSRAGLEPNESDHDSAMFSLPDSIPYGDYTIRMEIFCSNDSTPDNNAVSDSSDITIAEKGPPDLWFDSVRVLNRPDDNIYYEGDSITFGCRVENIGHSTSDSYAIDFRAGDYTIGSESRSGVVGHETDYFSSTYTLPDDIPEGFYSILAELSCSDDANPENNSAYSSIRVADKMPPDITIESVEAIRSIYKPGDPIAVRIRIECGDGQLPGECDIDFYASADTNISVADYKIQSTGFGNLEPRESYSFYTMCRFPSDVPDGDYHIGIIVTYPDEGDVVYDQRTVWVGAPVDLAVQTVYAAGGAYAPGDQIKVYSLVKNIGERACESYTIDFYLSTDTTITTTNRKIGYVNRSGLAPGEQHSYKTTCRLPVNVPEGDYYIGIIVTCPEDYDRANDFGRDTTTIELVHPPGYVCGRANYTDRWHYEHPIRYALVEIYADDNNNDPLDNRLIGQTHTDNNGDYGVVVLSDENGGHDIYVKVLAEAVGGACPGTTSKICVVKDDVLDETYSLASPLYPHPRDSSVMVNMTAPPTGGEFMVYDSVIEGFHKAKTFFGIELGEIATYWPCSEDFSYYDPSDAGIYIAQDDRGDRDVIMHEYGHYIADVYDFAQGSVSGNDVHYWDADLRYNPVGRTDEQAMNLAFREAWASLFSVATQYGDTGYSNSGDTKYQDVDENGEKTLAFDLEIKALGDYSPGQYFENMNANVLWDIFDDSVDDNDTLSDTSLQKIWTISRDHKPDNIVGFWDSWFRNYDYEQEMKHIFEAHEMPFVKPGR